MNIDEEFKNIEASITEQTPSSVRTAFEQLNDEYYNYTHASDDISKSVYHDNIVDLIYHFYEVSKIHEQVLVAQSTDIESYESLMNKIEAQEGFTNMGDEEVHRMLERVHVDSQLRNPNNYMHQFFVDTLGWWFEENDVISLIRKNSLRYGESAYLDQLAWQYGLTRKESESDDELRIRIKEKILEKFTTPTVRNSGVTFFTHNDFPHELLTSHNTYLKNKYLCYANDELENYWNDKYICWWDITWL